MLDFDLGGVAAAGTPLPEGTYQFTLEDLKIAVSKKGDSHNLKMKLTVSSEDENGRTHLENLNVQKSTLPFVKAWTMAILNLPEEEVQGFSLTSDDDGTVTSLNGEEVIGRDVIGVVKHVSGDTGTFGNIISWAPVPF